MNEIFNAHPHPEGPLPPVIPDKVRVIVEEYLQRVDEALPGQIEGLYLVGSLALDDFTWQRSDIDFVAVTRQTLSREHLDRLARIHAALHDKHPQPCFSGIYVRWSDLEHNPEELQDVPFHLDGHFRPSGGFDANPSIWLTLRTYPLAVRGPATPHVWQDLEVTRRWNLENLNSYWQGLASSTRSLSGRCRLLLVDSAVIWCVCGVTRLHYTVTTGDVTSKSGACRYALHTFPPRWHPLVTDALALHQGNHVWGWRPLSRRRYVGAYMQMVIDDANAFAAQTP